MKADWDVHLGELDHDVKDCYRCIWTKYERATVLGLQELDGTVVRSHVMDVGERDCLMVP